MDGINENLLVLFVFGDIVGMSQIVVFRCLVQTVVRVCDDYE